MNFTTIKALASVFLAIASSCVVAQPRVLTFEGLKNLEAVQSFYHGGAGGAGSVGIDLGVDFSDNGLGIVASIAGGSGNVSNMPSPSTVVFFQTGISTVMNVPDGFVDNLSFYYSSDASSAINVFDGLNATGNIIATIDLLAQRQANGCSDTGFCNWSFATATFAGIARSVDFAGAANYVGFDDIALGGYPLPLEITASFPAGTVGVTYPTVAPLAEGGAGAPFSWSQSGLPLGLIIDPSTGEVSGVPTQSGTFPVELTVTDSQSNSVVATFNVVIAATPVLQAPRPVPTVGWWGLLSLSLVLGAVSGVSVFRKRKNA